MSLAAQFQVLSRWGRLLASRGVAAVLVSILALSVGCSRDKSTGDQATEGGAGAGHPSSSTNGAADRGAAKNSPVFSMPADLSGRTFSTVKARFVAFGDSGVGNEGQFKVAAAMKLFCGQKKCDFALHLGDIVYPEGIESAQDPDIEPLFENAYAPIGIPIWLSLGNHDHYGNPDAWVDAYGPKGSRTGAKAVLKAHLPARYYTFKQGGVRFLALDTEAPTLQQAVWADGVLRKSRRDREPWVIAFGHHPRRSHGAHGSAHPELAQWMDRLLCHRVDLLVAGHEHDKQLLEPHCGVHQVISGAAAKLRAVAKGKGSLFALSSLGFAYFVAHQDTLRVSFHNVSGRQEFARTYIRTRPPPVCVKDGICNGMCSADSDCAKGMCVADDRCDEACTDDPDCGLVAGAVNACTCDRQLHVCELASGVAGQICACDPACQAGRQPCISDGFCDRGCKKRADTDCK